MKVLTILSNQTHLWSTVIVCGEHGNFRFKLEVNQDSVIYTVNGSVRHVVIKKTHPNQIKLEISLLILLKAGPEPILILPQ